MSIHKSLFHLITYNSTNLKNISLTIRIETIFIVHKIRNIVREQFTRVYGILFKKIMFILVLLIFIFSLSTFIQHYVNI